MKSALDKIRKFAPQFERESDQFTLDAIIDAFIEYGKEACEEQRELCYQNAEIQDAEIDEDSIINAHPPHLI